LTKNLPIDSRSRKMKREEKGGREGQGLRYRDSWGGQDKQGARKEKTGLAKRNTGNKKTQG